MQTKKQKVMYYILIYDIANPKRLAKALKTCRKYLYWVQRSVFEGELTKTQYLSLKQEMLSIIKRKEDSLIFYAIRNTEVVEKKVFGIEKNEITNFI